MGEKKEINIEQVQENISKLHTEKVLEEIKEEVQNIQTFLPKSVHKELRLFCLQNDLNLKDYCSQAIIEKAKKENAIKGLSD